MSNFPHDDFAKAYLTELLGTIGLARPNRPLKAETRTTDLWFEANPLGSDQNQLGLLGQLLTRDSLIEVFRNAPSPLEIRSCQGKLSDLEIELLRTAKRLKQPLPDQKLPYLWLITPTASDDLRAKFHAVPTDHPGVYHFPQGQEAGMIVTHHLLPTEDTMWLRILGRNGNQQRAIQEFATKPNRNDLYASIEERLADYRANLAANQKITPEDEELIMQLSALYIKQQQEWKEEGRLEEKQQVAIALLKEGLSPELIAKATGLSIDTIHQLQT